STFVQDTPPATAMWAYTWGAFAPKVHWPTENFGTNGSGPTRPLMPSGMKGFYPAKRLTTGFRISPVWMSSTPTLPCFRTTVAIRSSKLATKSFEITTNRRWHEMRVMTDEERTLVETHMGLVESILQRH